MHTFWKKAILLPLAMTAFPALATDGKTTFQYEHNWKTMDRRHNDSFKLIHKLSSGWQYELKFGTSSGGGSNEDVAFDDMQGGSGGMVISKTIALTKSGSITPSFEFAIGNSAVTYQPGLKYGYTFNKQWSVFGRYRYELKKVSRDSRYSTVSSNDKYGHADEHYRSKSDAGRHRLDAGFSYKITPLLSFSYSYNYYIGDYINSSSSYSNGNFSENEYQVYRGKKTDYEHDFKIQYQLTKQLVPYLEVDDVSYSGTSSSRQGKVKIGANYTF